jgi:hypothetical protein
MGATGTRYFLRPLFSEGLIFLHSSGALRREKVRVCRDVIACDKREAFAQGSGSDEAIRASLLPDGLLRWRLQ